MSHSQADVETVKDWLLARINQVIHIAIVQRTGECSPGRTFWKGEGKVVRCTKPGVVLELQGGHSPSWWSRIFHVFRYLGPNHVVGPWEERRLSVPYRDLSLEKVPTTGETWLLIDAATWVRTPEDLKQID